MKIKLMLFSVSLGLAATFSSCTNDNDVVAVKSETGVLNLDVVSSACFQAAATRAVNETSYTNVDNYTVEITDGAGAAKFSGTYSELKTLLPMSLKIGNYNIKAFYGTESVASRSAFYVEGSSAFQIKSDDNTTVSVDCLPTCGKVSAAFTSEMDTYFTDYSIAFYGTSALGATDANAVVWNKSDADPYYIKLNGTTSGETVQFKLNVTAKEGFVTGEETNRQQTGIVTGSFNLKRNEAHKLTIGPNLIEANTGNLAITITIDDTTNDIEKTITVPVTWIDKQ